MMMPFITVIGEIQPVVNKAGPESAKELCLNIIEQQLSTVCDTWYVY